MKKLKSGGFINKLPWSKRPNEHPWPLHVDLPVEPALNVLNPQQPELDSTLDAGHRTLDIGEWPGR